MLGNHVYKILSDHKATHTKNSSKLRRSKGRQQKFILVKKPMKKVNTSEESQLTSSAPILNDQEVIVNQVKSDIKKDPDSAVQPSNAVAQQPDPRDAGITPTEKTEYPPIHRVKDLKIATSKRSLNKSSKKEGDAAKKPRPYKKHKDIFT